jgi:hypothetical protein
MRTPAAHRLGLRQRLAAVKARCRPGRGGAKDQGGSLSPELTETLGALLEWTGVDTPIRQRPRSPRESCEPDPAALPTFHELELTVLQALIDEPAPWQYGEVAYRLQFERLRLSEEQRDETAALLNSADTLVERFYQAGLLERQAVPNGYCETVYTPLPEASLALRAERNRRDLPGTRLRASALS